MTTPHESQRIARLTPLAEVLVRVVALARPVAPRAVAVGQARGCVLAADVAVETALPAQAIALHDGWAVAADSVGDASTYAPMVLAHTPVFVATGDALPPRTDAVLPSDAVTMRGSSAEVVASAPPGEGVLASGADADPRKPLRCAGERLRAVDIAVLRAAGIEHVQVRGPRVRIVCATLMEGTADTSGKFVAERVEARGGVARIKRTGGRLDSLERALEEEGADATVIVGGTGEGPDDASVRTLARLGHVEVHGIALRPGETAALGAVGGRPVLLLPGRLDAALAAWLAVGRPLMARLTGLQETERGRSMRLMRKITSTIGLAEIIPVGACEGGVEPLASGHFPLQALARAESWIMIAPDSEGYAAGSLVEVMPFP